MDDPTARPPTDDRTLVEPEGVNAGSAAALSDDQPANGDVLGGGAADSADPVDQDRRGARLPAPRTQEPGGPGQDLSAGEG